MTVPGISFSLRFNNNLTVMSMYVMSIIFLNTEMNQLKQRNSYGMSLNVKLQRFTLKQE